MSDATTIIIRNAVLRERAIKTLSALPLNESWHFTVKPYKKNRSLAQNSLLWWWYKHISRFIFDSTGSWHSDDDLHEFFKAKYAPSTVVCIAREMVTVRKSTASMTVQEFIDFLTHIDHYCADDLDFILPHPESLYEEAMRKGI